MKNTNKNTNINKNTVNLKIDIRRPKPRPGSKTESKKIVRCGACQGNGYSDYPTCLHKCTICRGIGKVRV